MSDMHQKEAMVHQVFSELAPRYEAFNACASWGQYKLWIRALVKEAKKAGPLQEALDLAAGTGDIAFALAKSLDIAQIELSDFCEDMLNLALERYYRIQDSGLVYGSRMNFSIENAQELSYEDGRFDLVTVAYGLRNFSDRKAALAEAYRVLKPGGRYLILEFSRPPHPVWRSMYHIYLHVVIPRIGRLILGKRESFDYFKTSILQFPVQEAVVDMLREAGFRSVYYKNLSGGIVSLFTAIK